MDSCQNFDLHSILLLFSPVDIIKVVHVIKYKWCITL